jgi:formate-dependent nitrite reductase cytochrome c552 subunit
VKRLKFLGSATLTVLVVAAVAKFALFQPAEGTVDLTVPDVDANSKACIDCHEVERIAIDATRHWIQSRHGEVGVGCYACHAAGSGDPDAWEHAGFTVSHVPSPLDCAKCHKKQAEEFRNSHHASAARFVGSLDNFLGEVVEGGPAADLGCKQCHGSIVKVDGEGIPVAGNMALGADEWIAGETYIAAPTCTTCHMSATSDLPVTHDIGTRIAWTLRPVVSKRMENWEAKRENMKSVCGVCHGPTWVNNYFEMYDDAVELYNDKFGTPAKEIMDELKAEGDITAAPFDDEIEWTYFELWHHEGRRARMGAAMMGPDFVQWHGFYEVADNFYNEFLPEAEELHPGIGEAALSMEEHAWRKGLTAEEIEEMLEFYEERYGE